jgi:hypothetical protein
LLLQWDAGESAAAADERGMLEEQQQILEAVLEQSRALQADLTE